MQHTTDTAIERKFAATDGIDGHASRVWRIFDGKLHIDFHRHVAEEPAFDPDKGNLVIELPRHVIARADMDIFVWQTFADHGLHRFGFRDFLGRQSRPLTQGFIPRPQANSSAMIPTTLAASGIKDAGTGEDRDRNRG